MDKSPDAFRTISEVAADLDVPQHVLRFWESRFREIKPMKRGGGRRYYRPDDIDLLRGIRHLLYGEGYTIRGVQRILKDQGAKFVQAVWHPGAPQPAHGSADDSDFAVDDAETRAAAQADEARGRKLFGLLPSLLGDDDDEAPAPVRAEPRVPPSQRLVPPVVAPSQGMSRDDLRKLHSALHDLAECRRLLDQVLDQNPPGESPVAA